MPHPDYPVTPRLSEHARARCDEMHVETKRVKRLLREPDMTRPGHEPGRIMAMSDKDPDLIVVYKVEDGEQIVITVLFRSYDRYDRATWTKG